MPAETQRAVQGERGEQGFATWRSGFRARAMREGISAEVVDSALTLAQYQPRAIALDRAQAEFTQQVWEYLDAQVTAARIAGARAALERHAGLLGRIEARYGVEREVLVAIWGLESGFGAMRGTVPVIGTLASLAHDGRRAGFFEDELLAALRIIAAGDVSAGDMVGSWAGAMGHMQFMPSTFVAHAVDFNGDGRRDIWSDDPADALASAAAYLAGSGWRRGQPWAIEVALPDGFDGRLTGTQQRVADWRALGVRAVRGAQLPASGPAELYLPAGLRGPAVLIFDNYHVLKTYNISDSYVLAVGHLSDRLRGGGPFVGSWPRDDRALSLSERRELQRLLNARGFDTAGIDGRIGPATRAAVRDWQAASGRVADGYVSVGVLDALRRD